ncbi:MAG: hypothetical protein ACI8XO_002033 [Verrucomicrobiales bacterium]|jgi:hypothetical protein
MIYRVTPHFLVVATIVVSALLPSVLVADDAVAAGPPKTVRDLILEIGEPCKKHKQLKLMIEGELVGKELKALPKSMVIDLRYDKAENRVRLISNSIFVDGATRKVIVDSDAGRAAKWVDLRAAEEGAEPVFRVERVAASQALPNPWRLPLALEFPGIFADAMHGYEALSREFARSKRLNKEPDPDGLVWFSLRPAPGVANVLQAEFNAGMKVKAGFATEAGWIERMEVEYPKAGATIKFKVVSRSTTLSEGEIAEFGIPGRVIDGLKPLRKPRDYIGEGGARTPEVAPQKSPDPAKTDKGDK